MFAIKSSTFGTGAVVLLGWFLWQGLTVAHHGIGERLVFYVIALLAWQPAAAWLKDGMRWIPAAELFFLLHIPYYVTPFVSSEEDSVGVEPEALLQVGLVILLFLLVCRCCYRVSDGAARRSSSGPAGILDREMNLKWGTQLAWGGVIGSSLWTVSLQQQWLSDLGSYFNTVRTVITSLGNIGLIILFYEMGRGRLEQVSKVGLIAITTLAVLFGLASGFLIGAIMLMAVVILAFFLGSRRLPLKVIMTLFALLAFLHAGKGDMRSEFWDEGRNYSVVSRSPLDIFGFWIAASWDRITTGSDSGQETPSLFKRGSLLNYVSLVVAETPNSRDYMAGLTYWQTAMIFVPRFLWPDKPRASTPDETLAIYYGVQTIESVEVTAIGLGRISEAWANFGWAGVIIAGAVMGLILRIPTRLSDGFSPLSPRFLLAGPFIGFGMNLEACFGSATHALSTGLVLTFACLWVISVPAAGHELAQGVKRSRSDAASPAQQNIPSPVQ